MKVVRKVEEMVNPAVLPQGSRIYCAGNAATPQVLLKQLITDTSITDVTMYSVLPLGDIEALYSPETCRRIHHRIIFNSHHSRTALNDGLAGYQLMHLSDIPKQLRHYLKPTVAMLSVSGPDNGGNFSLGTTVEGVLAAIETAREQGGLVLAERNTKMPFVLGTAIKRDQIDYLIDTEYELPKSPVKRPDERARKIGNLIGHLYVGDGTTLQYGIGEVPEAVTDAIIAKEVRDLGIHTELFADAMRVLVDKGIVTNRFLENDFSVASIFLSSGSDGYEWLDFNSSVQSRPCDHTNHIRAIARQPRMISINSAIGVDLHGNVWADSLLARNIYSGVGGQADFIRGAYLSEGGVPVIAMKSTTAKGVSKIVDKCPEGITTTAIAADPVVVVTEHGAFDTRGLSITEQAIGIAHLAAPEHREGLLRVVHDGKEFHKPSAALKNTPPKGFFSVELL